MPRVAAAFAFAVVAGLAVVGQPITGPGQGGPGAEGAADRPFEGSFVSQILFEGLETVDERLARNQLRSATGRPLDWDVVRDDVRRLERLGSFSDLRAEIEPLDNGTVAVVFVVREAPVVTDIAVVGNLEIPDGEIANVISENIALVAGVPVDEFRIQQAIRAIEDLYARAGYYQVRVTVDEDEIAETGMIIFRVREGERVRITAIRFEGNIAFTASRLQSNINTRRAGIFERGPIDQEIIDRDVAAVRRFYEDEGYLDARVSHRLTLSPDGREAILTFLVDEGPRFTVREVLAFTPGVDLDAENGGLTVMSPDQIAALSFLKPGAVIEGALLRDSRQRVQDAYRSMGYVDATVRIERLRLIDENSVDVLILVTERDRQTTTDRFRTGLVTVQGNELTQHKVIRRRLNLEPDRWLNAALIEESERQLRNSQLFDPAGTRITILDEDPNRPGYRDVVVEVQEANTGALTFGASVNSDAGLIGQISLSQRNFDLFDTPDSFEELFRGRAFRGGGQQFNLLLAPGTELSNYSVSLSEPNVFESDYRLTTSAFFRQRDFDLYDEDRLGGSIGVSRAFGVRWTGGITMSAQGIEIADNSLDPLQDIADVEGDSLLTEIGFELNRTTVDDFFRPGRGARTEFRVTQAGALGGEYTFTRLEAEHTVFFSLFEDELGRKTTIRFNTRAGWVPDDGDLPIFERFYLGGRSFRGFEFRGIGPIGRLVSGEESNEKVGGSFLFFAGLQYQQPLFSDLVDWVAFVDSGTIEDEISLDNYRVSAGLGLRLFLPQFGRAPLAFDFAFPVVDFEDDESQIFSFSIELPF